MREDESVLTKAIIDLATDYGRYGYRRVTALLHRQGWQVNHKRVARIWRREGVNRKLKCPLFRILKCPLVDKEMAVSIILCISPYLATVPVSLQAHVPTTLPCASLSTGNSPP